jgi:hypothetical protein
MTSNRPGQATRPRPAGAVPRPPMVCQYSSASTSFMLATLRVLHVDTSHAQAGIARIKEQTLLEPSPPAASEVSSTQPQSNRTKKTRRRPREERPAFPL